jgi:hypothetical protein
MMDHQIVTRAAQNKKAGIGRSGPSQFYKR